MGVNARMAMAVGAGARVRSARGARVRSSSRPLRAARTRRAAAAEDVATATEASSPCSSSSSASSRYVASNRFSINPGAAAKFEARWATRKSRLAVLDGFRFFSLLRLTGDVDGAGAAADELGLYNYVSFTIWSEKKDFNAWRTGEAFKEAHGGGTIFGFVDMLVNSIGVLRVRHCFPHFSHGRPPEPSPTTGPSQRPADVCRPTPRPVIDTRD